LVYPNVSCDYYGVLKYSKYIFELNSETIEDRGLRITVSIVIITQIPGCDISTGLQNSHLNLGLEWRVENALIALFLPIFGLFSAVSQHFLLFNLQLVQVNNTNLVILFI